MQVSEQQKLVYDLLNEAWNNPTFKAELVANPTEAIFNLTGQTIQLPAGVKRIKVVDQTDSSVWNINIPAQPDMDNVELSEQQMEIVAGGGSLFPNPIDILIPTLPTFPFPGGTGPYNPYPPSEM